MSDSTAPAATAANPLAFIVYKLGEPDPKTGKHPKVPVHPVTLKPTDKLDRNIWLSHVDAKARAAALGEPFGIGVVIHEGSGLFFFDADSCVEHGSITKPEVVAIIDKFRRAGCYIELSVSGTGVHGIGTYSGPAPTHINRIKVDGLSLELYSGDGNFCALTETPIPGTTLGSMSANATLLLWEIAIRFPKDEAGAGSDELTNTPRWPGRILDLAQAVAARRKEYPALGVMLDGPGVDSDQDHAVCCEILKCTGGNGQAALDYLRNIGYKWSPAKVGREDYYQPRTIRHAFNELDVRPSVNVTGVFVGALPAGASLTPITSVPRIHAVPAIRSPSERFPIYTFDEMISRPRLQWLIKGAMPAEGVAAIYGPAGSGKSFLLLDMLGAVATGSHWFGRPVKKSPVLYIALEGAAGFQQRTAAYAKKFGTKPEMLFITAPLDICQPDDLAALVAAIRAKGWQGNGVIAVDTLNAAMPGRDENGPQDMGAAIAGLKVLQRAFGGLAIIVHHTGKNITAGLRGHSSLHGALDASIEVAREGLSPVRTWNMAKLKDGADGEGPTFTLESVYLGTDEDGDSVTSCVIARPAAGVESAAVTVKPQGRIGKNQRLALDILNKLLADPGAMSGLPATVPTGRPAVAWEVAKQAVGKDYQLEEKRKGPEARRVIQSLIESGWLTTDGEYLWRTIYAGPELGL
ncbi:MAG TPA: AAA family ATPase [Steroidobacteraceae bacterium]|nr:AAA family ATPase [Steroidobacteraceae bacterium]